MQKLTVILRGLRDILVALFLSMLALVGVALGVVALLGIHLIIVATFPELAIFK